MVSLYGLEGLGFRAWGPTSNGNEAPWYGARQGDGVTKQTFEAIPREPMRRAIIN